MDMQLQPMSQALRRLVGVTVPFCALCRDSETEVTEYPLADCLSTRSHPHDSRYLVSGARDRLDLIEPVSNGAPWTYSGPRRLAEHEACGKRPDKQY
jgi:hypothetical protein